MTELTVTGNISEPSLRFTGSGTAVLNFNLADNHRRYDKQSGEWQDDGTTWRRVALWAAKGEAAAEALQKGDRVIVVGSERNREFEGSNGEKRWSLEITARDVGVIPKQTAKGSASYKQAQAGTDPWASSDDNPPF